MARKLKPIDPGSDEAEQVKHDFDRHVNMTASKLERWLETDESKAVGQKEGGGDSVGRASGKRIVELLRKKKGD